MHPNMSELSTSVPAFLAKLWKLVEDPNTDNLIYWSPSGKSFCIRNQAQFAKELLPHYYKHNNLASFVRQLNMYGFHKRVSVDIGGLKSDKDEMEFVHQNFCKGQPYLVDHIKRKITSSKTQDQLHPIIKQELMNKVLLEVKNMKGRQEHLDTRMGAIRNENEALWRELAMLRQKHIKQQQIVNKLIHFLITLVHRPRGGGLPVKRQYPLMLNDSSRARKARKLSKSDTSPIGPVIHELDASEPDLDSEYIVDEMLENKASTVQSPENTIEFIDDDNMKNINLENPFKLKDDIMNSQIDIRKKAVEKSICTNKTKRKKVVPVKISIPSLTNGEKPREELHFLDMPDEAPTIAFLNNDSVNSKAVPMATVPSSKLVAMAANIKKSQDTEYDIDLDTSADLEDDTYDNDTAVTKLENILIVPHIIDDDDIQNVEDKENDDSGSNRINKGFNQIDDSKYLKGNNESYDANSIISREEKDKDYNMASTSSKDLSLSCINPSDVSQDNYRKEMDNHVETIQTDLVNLRELLSEGYNLNNNTLYELFSDDDTSPIELQLNDKEDINRKISDSVNGFGGGELMTYNPSSSLLDFDDIFLNAASSSLLTLETPDFSADTIETSDPLNLEDSKTLFLDYLVTKDANSKS